MSTSREFVAVDDIEYVSLSEHDFQSCIAIAQNLCRTMVDRGNLHSRDIMEKFNNILMGEVAEMMVIRWLHNNGKYAVSAVDKNSGQADLGHDIYLKAKDTGIDIRCSVKSSLSYKLPPNQILKLCTLASTRGEMTEVNIQVYFWLVLNPDRGTNRVTTPSINNAAIFSWFGSNDIKPTEYSSYETEKRKSPNIPLQNGRKMNTLLNFIKDV